VNPTVKIPRERKILNPLPQIQRSGNREPSDANTRSNGQDTRNRKIPEKLESYGH